MRLTRYHLFLLGGLFLIFMGPLAFTQPGPGGSGGKGGGKGFDPGNIFTFLSGGKETFNVKTVQIQSFGRGPTPEEQKEQMMAFLQKKGVTDGTMSKELFVEYFQQRMAEAQAKRAEQIKQGTPPPGAAPTTPGAAPAPPAQDLDAQARASFERHDTDKNGSLSVEEMQAAGRRSSRIYEEREKWDTNKNGTIELAEYIEYYKAQFAPGGRFARGGQTPPPSATPVEPAKPVEEDKRPTVYRTGKLPKELPAWFEEADKDKDGQVGLYEWKAGGKSVSEFLAMDHNGDGFITVEEMLRHQRVVAKATDSPTLSSSPSYAPSPTRFGPSQADSPRGYDKGDKGGNRWNFGGRGKSRMKGG